MSKKLLQAAAGNAGESLYVEDVFSTYLYTGTGSALTITNGIDLDGEGGLVWIKGRSGATGILNWDTTMSPYTNLSTYNTDAIINQTSPFGIASANTDGFSIGNTNWSRVNASGSTYASWTFRKAEKFFDVVTYTGDGSNPRNISHNLDSVPGCVIVKPTSTSGGWLVWHREMTNASSLKDYYLQLQTTDSISLTYGNVWGSTNNVTSTSFQVSSGANANGETYVAYLFAHDAGGFGDDGSESIIKCGSLVSGTVQDIDLGWEPQFIIYKNASSTGGWTMFDVMRGMTTDGSGTYIQANTTAAEATASAQPSPLANGFRWNYTGNSGNTFIYIAIRRPMKTPESGTEVFAVDTRASSGGTLAEFISGFPVDMYLRHLVSASFEHRAHTRLLGQNKLITNTTAAEVSDTTVSFASNVGAGPSGESANSSVLAHMFRRATGFFDVVCYTGVNSTSPKPHNLGVAPELMIVKKRSSGISNTLWAVYSVALGNTKVIVLNSDSASYSDTLWNNTSPTSTGFTLGANLLEVNYSGQTYVAYLFATVAGVSKVGSYTGTGSNVDVDCGFSAGARFILIKRTDSTGDWYVWDSVRGIVAGNDPYLLLNSTAAEVTSTDYIDPLSSGFTVTSSAPAALNASGGNYIFLAIA